MLSVFRFFFCCLVLASPLMNGLVASSAQAETRPLVVFANPADSDDVFFKPVTDFMQAAANDLGFELVTYYGKRNHVDIDENVTATFQREPLPDYLISMNARGSGKATLDLAEKTGIKTIFINQGFVGDDKKNYGNPGELYKQWIFEYLPDDSHAGYILTKELIEEAIKKDLRDENGFINIVALGGHETSPASILREQGLNRAVSEYPKARLLQLAHADWKREKAYELSKRLIKRYPNLSIIWTASDHMGAGIVDGIRESGKTPGKDILTGGVDWAAFAMDMVANGDFTVTIGGHFMDGAWAMVMLYDYIHGEQVTPSGKSHFSAITAENLESFRTHFGTANWEKIDFRKFSKHLNPEIKEYDFSLEAVLKQVQH